jgi:hypothetical protein
MADMCTRIRILKVSLHVVGISVREFCREILEKEPGEVEQRNQKKCPSCWMKFWIRHSLYASLVFYSDFKLRIMQNKQPLFVRGELFHRRRWRQRPKNPKD